MCRPLYIICFSIICSGFYNARADRISKMMGKKLTILFSLKSLLSEHTASALLFFLLVISILYAYILRIIEGPLHDLLPPSSDSITDQNNYKPYLNSFWNVLITMTTVGYGDCYPRTTTGRAISSVVSLSGTIVVAMIINFFQGVADMNQEEKNALTFIDRLDEKEEIKSFAVNYFFADFKYRWTKKKMIKKYIENNDKNKKLLIKLARERYEKKKTYIEAQHKYQLEYNNEENVDKIQNKINSLDNALIDMKNQIKDIHDKLKILIKNIIDEGNN